MAELNQYASQFETRLAELMRQTPDWKQTAEVLEKMAVDGSLIPESAPPLSRESPEGFAQNLISDQDSVLENSNLTNLSQQNWDPQNAETAEDLLSHLLL